MSSRDILIAEFTVRIFTGCRVDWDGADEFLWWILHRKLVSCNKADADKIAQFGILRAARGRPKPSNKNRPRITRPGRLKTLLS